MGKIATSDFHTHSAGQFVESVTEDANTSYYVFQGKHTAWPTETSPPTPNTSLANSFNYVWDTMTSGIRLTTNDVKHMVEANVWTTGTKYDRYDDQVDMTAKNDVVFVEDRSGYKDVFRCLDNNGGEASNLSLIHI